VADERPEGARLARYYDLDLGTDPTDQPDLDLYLALARSTGGNVLELAVGTGRLAAPLAEAGHAVTGVDHDDHMLARARQRSTALELVEDDLTSVRLGRSFDLVMLALNSLLLLDGRPAQARALQTIAAHLAPGGRAVLDVWLPTPDDLAIYDGRLVLDWLRRDDSSGELVAKTTSARHQPATNRAEVVTFFDAWPPDGGPAHRTVRRDALHFVGASELLELVERAGLAAGTVAGDYAMNDLGPDSERVLLICGLR
jgi:SAM-dependent methyltransferase